MRRFAKLPTDFSNLLPNIRLAFGVTDVESDNGVEYALVSGGSLTGTVTVPTASVGASGLELINKEWVERAIDVLPVAPEISPEFTGLVLGVSPTSLRSTGEAATKEYVDGFSKQWSGCLPALSPDFQGTPQVEYSEDADITGSVVAKMGVGYGSLADAVSISEVDDISTAAGEVIEAISADKFAPLDSPTFTGDVSVESSDLTYSGNEVVSSWWVTQRAQSDDSAAEVTDFFGAIPWFDLSLLSPVVPPSMKQ